MEEITTVWFKLKKDAFIDYSLLANGRLGWDKVEMLQPLQQPCKIRGSLPASQGTPPRGPQWRVGPAR